MPGDIHDGARLDHANRVLAEFGFGGEFVPWCVGEYKRGDPDVRSTLRIHLRHKGGNFRVRLSNDGAGLNLPRSGVRFGGTAEEAVAQLYRYTQGMTRRPLHWWETRVYYRDIVGALKATDYLEPEKTACVLCHRQAATCDWWCAKGLQGPCCTFGKCQEKEARP